MKSNPRASKAVNAFELETATKAKLTDVLVLSQKNRTPGDNPGAALAFTMSVPNDILVNFDGHLKSFLYTKQANSSGASKQGALEAVAPVSDMPNLTNIGMKVGKLPWDLNLTGYEATIDHGIGRKESVLELSDCQLSKFHFHCKEGGTVEVSFSLETQDVTEKTFGKLATLKNLEVSITLTAPEIAQDDIEE